MWFWCTFRRTAHSSHPKTRVHTPGSWTSHTHHQHFKNKYRSTALEAAASRSVDTSTNGVASIVSGSITSIHQYVGTLRHSSAAARRASAALAALAGFRQEAVAGRHLQLAREARHLGRLLGLLLWRRRLPARPSRAAALAAAIAAVGLVAAVFAAAAALRGRRRGLQWVGRSVGR